MSFLILSLSAWTIQSDLMAAHGESGTIAWCTVTRDLVSLNSQLKVGMPSPRVMPEKILKSRLDSLRRWTPAESRAVQSVGTS